MSSVDERIVSMKFDNKQFDSNAKSSLSILDRLKSALNFKNSGKGLTDLQNSANRFSLSGLTNGASQVGAKFSAMSVVAIAALANIVGKAVDAGLRVAKAFTLEPLKQGFAEYETNLNAVQTILSNTASSGATLKDVNSTLNDLNTYSDQTIYNFSEMAKNIGTFTAAGVDLKTSAMSIKGIANLAALSGSNSQQASTAMYQLSQAISSGRVSLQDWNSVVNAGMGGTVFQRALAQNAERMGTLSKGAVELKGKMKNVSIEGKSFRESITAKPGEQSWLTSDVLTETLKQFTGDLSEAQIQAMGFSKEMAHTIYTQGQTAKNAATQVKTASQLIGTLQESAGSGWAQSFQILFGDFEEAKTLFTGLNNVLGGYISGAAKARNTMLQSWKDLGGRKALIESFQNVFKAIVQLVTPIRDAFREIFPATTGKQLYQMTTQFLAFTKSLKFGSTTLANIRRTAAGFFAIFSIGWSVIKGVLNVFGQLFHFISGGTGSFLEVTGTVGDFLVKLDQTIKKGDLINKFFSSLGHILQGPIAAIKAFGSSLVEIIKGFRANGLAGIGEAFGRITDRIHPLIGAGSLLQKAWSGISKMFQGLGNIMGPVIDAISNAMSGLGDALAKAFKAGDFNSVYDALNTGLLTGIVLLIRKFFSTGFKVDLTGGFGKSIKETFETLTSTLKAMQTQIQAKTLLTIAGAVALLTASVVALSLIDSGKLSKSLTAMAVSFGQLLFAMSILTKITASGGFLKVPFIAASMVLLAGAVVVLTAAVAGLSKLSWGELVKGLTGVGALLAMIVLVSRGLDKSSGGILRAGLAMLPLAIGLKVMASVVQDFGSMDWGTMAKGLVGMAGALLVIAGAIALMPPTMIAQAAGLLVLSVALIGIGKALDNMGGMKWGEIAKAMVVLAGSLLILAGGLFLMEAALPGAAALIVAAGAFALLTPVLMAMGQLSWEAIAKGMVTLAGSLLILAAGLTLMSGAVVGAAALVIAAGALAVLAPVLVILGAMSWEAIGKGLVALAGAFTVLGLSSLILMPLIPAILGLSASLLVLGAAMALIGTGALALATAFSIFVAAGTAGIAVVSAMINLIPQFLTKFAEGIIGFATTIASQADKFISAFASLLNSLLDAVIQITPKIGRTISVLLQTILTIIINNAPRIAAAGVRLMVSFLTAIRGKIGQITALAADIIVKFLSSMSRQVPRIATVGTNLIIKLMSAVSSQQGRLLQAGASMIISFINNLASTLRNNSGALNSAGANLASAIISGMAGGLFAGVGSVIGAAVSVASSALAAAKNALGIHSPSKEFRYVGKMSAVGLANGLSSYASVAERSAEDLGKVTVAAIQRSMSSSSKLLSGVKTSAPVIKPVVDLRNVNQAVSTIKGMSQKLPGKISFSQASAISRDEEIRRTSTDGRTLLNGGDTVVKFEQNNYSPKALSPVELYRNTKSVLGQAKGVLGK